MMYPVPAVRNGILILALWFLSFWALWSLFYKNTVSPEDYNRMQSQVYHDRVEYVRNAKGLIFIQTKRAGPRIFFHKGEYQLLYARGELENLVFTGDSIVKDAWSDTIIVFPHKYRRAAFDSLFIVNDFDKMKRIWGY